MNKKKEMSIAETATLMFLGFITIALILLNVKSIFFSDGKDVEPVAVSYTGIVNTQNGKTLYEWDDVSSIRKNWGKLEVFPDSLGKWVTIGGLGYIYYENGKESPVPNKKQVNNNSTTP